MRLVGLTWTLRPANSFVSVPFGICENRNTRSSLRFAMATNQTQFAWPLRKPQQLVYVELGPYNGGMMLGICDLGLTFRAVAPLTSDGPINFTFALDGKTRLQGVGEIAWTEEDGKTGGLKFTNVSPQFRESLRTWLEDEVSPKNAGREFTPASALPLDSMDKIKSSIREGKTEAIRASVLRTEEHLVEKVPKEECPTVIPSPVQQVFQETLVPSQPDRPPLEALLPQPDQTPAVASSAASTFALPNFRLPSASPPAPPSPESATTLPALGLPETDPTFDAAPFPLAIPPTDPSTTGAEPPLSFGQDLFPQDLPTEPPRLNRAAAAGIVALALAVILGALVLNFRREVGETLIRLGQQLASEQQPRPSTAQPTSEPATTTATNEPAPSILPENATSPAPSHANASAVQTPIETAQSAPTPSFPIQKLESLPAPEDDGSGQKEFEQAKNILKGNRRQSEIPAAVALLWAGVRKGFVPAEVALADLYARGDGVEQSCAQARVLLQAAAQKGSAEGRRKLDLLKQQGCPAD
jgi:hypothetical protein